VRRTELGLKEGVDFGDGRFVLGAAAQNGGPGSAAQMLFRQIRICRFTLFPLTRTTTATTWL
jgi:hypothetical protein